MKKNRWAPDYVRDISEAVYRVRLEQSCAGNVARMIAKDGDNGEQLRRRAESYDPLTRVYLNVLLERGTLFPLNDTEAAQKSQLVTPQT